MSSLGYLLRVERMKKGESLIEASKAMGISHSYLNYIELRDLIPSIPYQRTICWHYNIDISIFNN